jgi:two-component system, NarL family, sensor kinase
MTQSIRTHLVVIITALGAVLLGAAFLLLHLTGPSDGARLSPGQPVWRPDGVVVTPLQPGGLHQGDVVVAVGGKSMESWAQGLFEPGLARPQWRVGQTITYTVLRHGHSLDVPVTLGTYPLGTILVQEWSTILYAVVFLLVAAFVFLRRSGDRAARVQLLIGSNMLGATTWSFGLQVSDLVNGIGFWLFKATTLGVYLLFWIALLHFALIFPRPHSITVKWRSLIPLLYIVPYLCALVTILSVWPLASSTLDWIGRWSLAENIFPPISIVLSLILALWAYRTARSIAERQKIRWIVYAGLLSGAGGLFLWQVPNMLGHPIISTNALGLLVLPYPFALAIAILRYHLFDIDTIINRTLVYGTLTVSVVGMYVLIVSMVSMLFHPSSAFLPSLLATGLVAVLFQPLHARLQRVVNRLIYGERDDPYAVLSRLGSRLEETLIPEAVLPTVVQTVAQALKLPYAAITLKQGETFAIAASYGLPQHELFTLPLVYHSETVGQLQLAPRSSNETFTAADRRLLSAIASHVGVAAHAVRLTADLQRSREHLVTTREEERRRLRRDLHDGLGPTLASMTLKLDAARNLLRQNSPALDPLLCELKAQTQATIVDIRRLVYDLRPPALDELGLVSALHEQIVQYSQASGVQMVIEAPSSLPSLPAAVEVATYRIVLEALTNVVRHAQAHTCHVRLQASDVLAVDVIDDGVGLPIQYDVGVGISSMRERTAELGGTCRIESNGAEGTHILVRLPLRKE